MANHQTIVDRIQAFVRAADQTNSPELAELASEYAALCGEANTRLRRCTDYLRRGLRSEAIHQAEEHPALLELVAALDLKEAAEWETVCANYELAKPVPLLIEAAQELNEAYAADQPLQTRLDRHRRLAMERAPLAQRLAVMRELADLDKASPFWEDDVRTFETARVKALRAESSAALKRRDRAALADMLGELQAPGWRVELPAELITSVAQADATFAHEDVVAQVEKLMPALDDAYGAMDLTAVTESITAIRSAASATPFELPPPLLARLLPAEQWCHRAYADAKRRAALEAAVAAVSEGVDRQLPTLKLLSLKAAATADGDPLPDELNARLGAEVQRQAAVARARARRRVLVVVGLLVVVLAAGAAVMWQVWQAERGRVAVARLSRLCDEANFDGVDEEVARLTAEAPAVLKQGDVVAVLDRVDKARRVAKDKDEEKQRTERIRVAGFDEAVAAARTAIAQASAPAADAAEPNWSPAAAHVREADDLAKNADEKRQAQAVADQLSAARAKARDAKQARLAEDDKRLAAEFDEVDARVRGVEALVATDKLPPGSAEMAAAGQQARALLARVPDDDRHQDLRQRVGAAVARLDIAARSSESRAGEQSALAAVRGATRSATALADALRQFGRDRPTSARAARFAAAATAAGSWAAVDAYESASSQWAGTFDPPTADLQARIDAVAGYVRRFPETPWSASLDDYGKYLAAHQKAVAANGPWRTDFRKILDLPIVRNLTYLQTKQGTRFYLVAGGEPPKAVDVGLTIKYVTSANLDLTRLRTLKPIEIDPTTVPKPCPQVALGGELAKMIDAPPNGWESLPADVAAKIADAKDVDEILKTIILGRAVRAWKAQEWGTGGRLAAVAATIDKLNAEDLPWMDPESFAAQEKRPVAGQKLAGWVTDLKAARDAAADRREKLRSQAAFRLVGRGVLLDEPGGWRVYTGDRPPDAARGFVAGGRSGWTQVADVRDGRPVVDATAVEARLDGFMVFFVAPAAPARPAAPAAR